MPLIKSLLLFFSSMLTYFTVTGQVIKNEDLKLRWDLIYKSKVRKNYLLGDSGQVRSYGDGTFEATRYRIISKNNVTFLLIEDPNQPDSAISFKINNFKSEKYAYKLTGYYDMIYDKKKSAWIFVKINSPKVYKLKADLRSHQG